MMIWPVLVKNAACNNSDSPGALASQAVGELNWIRVLTPLN